MRWVHFIDTSVMTNLLDLPGKNEHHEEAVAELDRLVKRRDTLILPVATVIETGNHIAHLKKDRFEKAELFAGHLRDTARGQTPWAFGPPFDEALLEQIADLLPEKASKGVGGGDTSIRVAFNQYVAETPRVSVRVWTYDSDLSDCVCEAPEIGRQRR